MKLTENDFGILQDHECGWKGKEWNLMLNFDSKQECLNTEEQILNNQAIVDSLKEYHSLIMGLKPFSKEYKNLDHVIVDVNKILNSTHHLGSETK